MAKELQQMNWQSLADKMIAYDKRRPGV